MRTSSESASLSSSELDEPEAGFDLAFSFLLEDFCFDFDFDFDFAGSSSSSSEEDPSSSSSASPF